MSSPRVTIAPPTRLALRLDRLEVANFGPVKEANLDFSTDVTFIVGPQSSGKTYLATLAYTLNRQAQHLVFNSLTSALAIRLFDQGLQGSISTQALVEFVRGQGSSIAAGMEEPTAIPFLASLPNSLPGTFGVNKPADLVRRGEDRLAFNCDYALDGLRLLRAEFTVPITGNPSFRVSISAEAIQRFVELTHLQLTVMGRGGWQSQFLGVQIPPTFFIPTERMMLLPIFSSYLSLLVQLSRPSGIQPTFGVQFPRFPQPLLDYMQDVTAAMTAAGGRPKPIDLLDFGQLRFEGGKVLFYDSKRSALTDLSRAASGVAQAAGIAFIAESEPPADTLFIEEPELNLHADAQLRITEYVSKLSARSRVVLTTHSQYVIALLGILRAQGKLRTLRGYFLNPASDTAEQVHVDEVSGSIALPRSIELALESLGEQAASLDKPEDE